MHIEWRPSIRLFCGPAWLRILGNSAVSVRLIAKMVVAQHVRFHLFYAIDQTRSRQFQLSGDDEACFLVFIFVVFFVTIRYRRHIDVAHGLVSENRLLGQKTFTGGLYQQQCIDINVTTRWRGEENPRVPQEDFFIVK